jgi:hypothetical protein
VDSLKIGCGLGRKTIGGHSLPAGARHPA